MELIKKMNMMKKIIIMAHMPCIFTFKFNQFECVCYKQMLILIYEFIYILNIII